MLWSEATGGIIMDEKEKNNSFSNILYDFMISHNLTNRTLAEQIGVSCNTIRNWLRGRKISNQSYIKCMRFFLDFEEIDYDSNTKLKEII